jgi:Nuclease-related domain
MAGKRHDEGRVCLCDRPDGTCAGLTVRRLSPDRVQELAEEIWTASSGFLPPVRPDADPRSSRAGASAQAAYRRRRAQEREGWRLGWLGLTWAMAGAALAAGLLLGATFGAWLGWPAALLAAVLTWWRLRFRPSPQAAIWRRQAARQRRTAAMLGPLEHEGYLVLHDVTLPGWLDSLDQLVVGPTGVWVVASCRRRRRLGGDGAAPPGILSELRAQAEGVAEMLDGLAEVPVRSLLCLHGAWLGTLTTLNGSWLAGPRRLADLLRSGSKVAPADVELATARLLKVLRPAA